MIRTEYDAKGRPIAESYEDLLIESLKDPAYAKAYLNAALEDEDYRVFLLALRDVANAFGIANLASNAELNRENIYKMLSAKGNPRISSLIPLLRAIGVRLKTEIDESLSEVTVRAGTILKVVDEPIHGNWIASSGFSLGAAYHVRAGSVIAENVELLAPASAVEHDTRMIHFAGHSIAETDATDFTTPVLNSVPAANQELALAA